MLRFMRDRIFLDHDPWRTAARIVALVRETLRIEGLVLFGFRVRVGVLFWFGSGGPWAWLFGWSNLAGTPSVGSESLPGRGVGVPLPPPAPPISEYHPLTGSDVR